MWGRWLQKDVACNALSRMHGRNSLLTTHLEEEWHSVPAVLHHVCMDAQVGAAMLGSLIKADAEEERPMQRLLGPCMHDLPHRLSKHPT